MPGDFETALGGDVLPHRVDRDARRDATVSTQAFEHERPLIVGSGQDSWNAQEATYSGHQLACQRLRLLQRLMRPHARTARVLAARDRASAAPLDDAAHLTLLDCIGDDVIRAKSILWLGRAPHGRTFYRHVGNPQSRTAETLWGNTAPTSRLILIGRDD